MYVCTCARMYNTIQKQCCSSTKFSDDLLFYVKYVYFFGFVSHKAFFDLISNAQVFSLLS